MPVSGMVITCRPEAVDTVREHLARIPDLEIHGQDDRGNIVIVIDASSSEEMERIIERINSDEDVLNAGMAYLNSEDEAERMQLGEKLARPFGFRKPG
jgi:nitrate reductase NapD